MVALFANSGDPDQTPRSAASNLGLHCLQNTFLGVSRLYNGLKFTSRFSQKGAKAENLKE